MYQSYEDYLRFNSSKLIASVTTYTDRSITAINALLNFLTFFIITLFIFFGITVINFKISFISILTFGLTYLIFSKKFKEIVNRNSQKITYKTELIIKSLQEGMGSIRDIILDCNQNEYINFYKKIDLSKRKLQAKNIFLGVFPRYAIEGITLFIIAILSGYFSNKADENISIIVLLGTLGLCAQKLLPAIQQIYNQYIAWEGFKAELDALLNIIDLDNNQFINFRNFKPFFF